MDLDVSAYGNIVQVVNLPDWDAWEAWLDEDQDRERTHVYVHDDPNPDFPARTGTLQTGAVYQFGASFDFRAGSYSGYNRWRNILAQLALGRDDNYVFFHLDEFKDKPFIELINFTDCDGILGPEVCLKLRDDFLNFQVDEDRLKELVGVFDWWKAVYEKFKTAFICAAVGESSRGFVVFR